MAKGKLKIIVLIIASALSGALFTVMLCRIMPERIYMHSGIMPQRIYLDGRELRIGEAAKQMIIMDGGNGLAGVGVYDRNYRVYAYANNVPVVEVQINRELNQMVSVQMIIKRNDEYVMIWYDKDAKVVLEKPIVLKSEPTGQP